MGITKIAENKKNAQRTWQYTNSAREAWSNIIEEYKKLYPNAKVLLPSYIGWSANEGSGIFDSVKNAGVDFEFYSLDKYLNIDISDLKDKVNSNENCLVLLVHYFGFTDNKYAEIVQWLDQEKICYIEDCAHAWLTDLVGGKCGRNGKYAFYSLHKILPLSKGGLLVSNQTEETVESLNPFVSLNYDLLTIYNKRRDNYQYLAKKIEDFDNIEILYKELKDGICPQTLPVILNGIDRDALYHKMNELGFGMVSLYHTMIQELHNYNAEACSVTHKKIINFPIHQDVNHNDLDDLIENLKKVLNV
ncbi:DegT/DnrJ/EryC1/StrS family aminotransferase [Chryseobacterium sp. RLHN22]|uniref:DegT/DnrJ/EryC1/StrS family aminotransferase n=1 Tax=Chryseobacterium sp. RLHN22 TaxID=3437885 RepID=UPI003D9B2F19